MIRKITKRDGTLVNFDLSKIYNAVKKANNETNEMEERHIAGVAAAVEFALSDRTASEDIIGVEDIQDMVEEMLMVSNFTKTAKAYILYREKNKRSLFKFRKNLKPYEYPELEEYKEAIQHSYWLHTEFNYTSDIQDFHVNVTDIERNAIKNAMLAIAQVEVAVKTFWGDLYHRMPKPELGSVGYTFAESEVRHHDAYAHLLDLLGLNDEFNRIDEIPALKQRVDYLTRSATLARTGDDEDYMLAILLFSLFTEHVSLFSQFLIIMAFNKHKNLFKGMSNAIEATSKEEQIHGLFGIDLINTIRVEKPEWFDEELEEEVYAACKFAYESEEKVIDWIYEAGDLDFMPKAVVKEFVKNRLNNSLVSVGYKELFDVDQDAVETTDWFDDEIVATKMTDFFNKRSVNYTKRSRAITSDDLF